MSTPTTFQAYPTVVKATLTSLLPKGKPITVQFNPASLVYTVENSTQQQAGDPTRRQYAAKVTGKLTMDLQFDTTDTGIDVRKFTDQVAQFMKSSAQANKKTGTSTTNKPAPPVLSFQWGAYQFQGFMESFKETIDFFSATGVPLRALVSIGLAQQDAVFDTGAPPPAANNTSLVPTAQGSSVTGVSTQGGDPTATRALASANGIENPRFTGGAALQVSGGIQLNPAVGFVASASTSSGIGVSGGLGLSLTASAGAGISASAGGGISATVSAGASAGISAGVSVSTSGGAQVTLAAGGGALFGSQASAGVPATAGAFAGLQTGTATVSTTAQLDPLSMLPATVGTDVAVNANASFGLGGVALAPSGFSSNVGASASITGSLTFDGD